MSVLSSILLIVSGLALIFMILNTRPSAREKKLDPGVGERMRLAAEIARASAREGFNIQLGYAMEDLNPFELLIEEGWGTGGTPALEEEPEDQPASRSMDDGFF